MSFFQTSILTDIYHIQQHALPLHLIKVLFNYYFFSQASDKYFLFINVSD